MSDTSHLIDLNKNWSLYNISGSAKGLGIDGPNAQNAIILPSANSETGAAKKHLRNPTKKKTLHKAIQADQPVPHFLGMLNFDNNIQQVVQNIELKTATNKVDEFDEAEQVVLTLHDQQAGALNDLNLTLKIFEEDTADTKVHAIFLDENGKQLHKQNLTAETNSGLKNSVAFNLGDTVTEGTTKGKKVKKIIEKGKKVVQKVKQIIVVIKKLFKKIKNIVADIKTQPAKAVVKALRFVKEKLTGNPYKILSYDFAQKDFKEIPPSEVDTNKRTLILLHGTIKGSFDGRIGKKKKREGEGSFKYLRNYQVEERGVKYKHWFDFLNQKSNSTSIKYEQVLSFEHETVLDGPKENVAQFIKWDVRFTQPVSIICASRGSLLAKCMAAHPALNQRMTIDRIAIVSGGYSDYFDNTEGIEAYVKAHQLLFPQKAHAFLESLLKVIPKLPGLEVQCKENDSFKAFIEADKVPAASKKVIYYNMTNNFPFHDGIKIDVVAKQFLGADNDLALSLDAQRDCRPGVNHPDFPPYEGEEKHGDGLRLLKPKQQLFDFLTRDLS